MNIKSSVLSLFLIAGATQCESQTTKQANNMKTNNQTATSIKEIIVDVRTPEEWNEDGHVNCSVNYPLDQFESKIDELKNYTKITLVCRSGNRAGIAKAKLIKAGYKNEVENAGAWQNISCKN